MLVDTASMASDTYIFRVGLVINPYAGVGGEAGYKGSDSKYIQQQAAAGELPLKACDRTERFLDVLQPHKSQLHFIAPTGVMGESLLTKKQFVCETVGEHIDARTTAAHTKQAVKDIMEAGVDLLVFVGGDGTARDVCDVIEREGDQAQLCVGIPSGVKMYSGVYGIHPTATAEVVIALMQGRLAMVAKQEVRDIDEDAFRRDRVISKYYGELNVPCALEMIQQVKQSGVLPDELALLDMASEVRQRLEHMFEDDGEENVLTIFAPGSTTAYMQNALGFKNTLLGVDTFIGSNEKALDVSADELYAIVKTHLDGSQNARVKLILTAIGGQGHLIGRGNQQLRADTLALIGKGNIWPVCTQEKLYALDARPLIVDSNNASLNRALAGFIPVITGFNQTVLYRVAAE